MKGKSPTKAEVHYLNCMDDNCERVTCVHGREQQFRIQSLMDEVGRYRMGLKNFTYSCKAMCPCWACQLLRKQT